MSLNLPPLVQRLQFILPVYLWFDIHIQQTTKGRVFEVDAGAVGIVDVVDFGEEQVGNGGQTGHSPVSAARAQNVSFQSISMSSEEELDSR